MCSCGSESVSVVEWTRPSPRADPLSDIRYPYYPIIRAIVVQSSPSEPLSAHLPTQCEPPTLHPSTQHSVATYAGDDVEVMMVVVAGIRSKTGESQVVCRSSRASYQLQHTITQRSAAQRGCTQLCGRGSCTQSHQSSLSSLGSRRWITIDVGFDHH